MDTPRRHNAGTVAVGVGVSPLMIIPPHLDNFNIYGVCESGCTRPVSMETITLIVCVSHNVLMYLSL